MTPAPTGSNCEFCAIRDGLAPARIVAETPEALAFLPLNPATNGHSLLIPRHHVPDLWSMDEETAVALTRMVVPLSSAIRAAVEPDGFNLINSTGEVAGQSVFHFHLHLVPRWADDQFGEIWPSKRSWDPRGQDAVQEAIAEMFRHHSEG